jgi:hypothetical protein
MLSVNVNISLQMKAGGKLPSASYLLAMTVNSELFNAVCHFLSNLTPNPFPTREGEQESKPLSLWATVYTQIILSP